MVPAAGASARMGRPKLLLPWGEGETVVGSLLAALGGGGVRRIALVLAPPDGTSRGRGAAGLRAWAEGRPLTGGRLAAALTLAENPTPERGMLSSILAGVDALGGAAGLAAASTALLVTPGDLPALRPETVAAVAATLRDGAGLAAPRHGGHRGHPLGIAPGLLPEIATLDLDRGLRQLLERHPDEVVEVPVDDPGAVRDIDSPSDYLNSAPRGAWEER